VRRAALLAFLAGCAALPPQQWTSKPLPDQDDRFLREDSLWRGGDAVYSVPITRDRILWLFGDTFIAPPGGVGRSGSRMVRNTIAIQKLPGDPVPFWRSEAGRPGDAFKPASGEGWLWPLSGMRIGSRLQLFMMQMTAKGEGAFGFAFSKSVILTVENPDDEPAHWKTQQRDLPHSLPRDRGNVFFGGASVLLDTVLYVFGVQEDSSKGMDAKGIIVAKVNADALADFPTWRFFTGTDWSAELPRAKALHYGGSIEMSVTPLNDGFVSIYTRQGMSPEILLRRAPKPEGPWSEPIVVHRCPEPGWNKNYFCYAAKAHPELAAAKNEIMVSYACNSMSFPDVFRDLRIYRPRFVRLSLD
jgi:hypothetical protein